MAKIHRTALSRRQPLLNTMHSRSRPCLARLLPRPQSLTARLPQGHALLPLLMALAAMAQGCQICRQRYGKKVGIIKQEMDLVRGRGGIIARRK
jgi:hypothetical protein